MSSDFPLGLAAGCLLGAVVINLSLDALQTKIQKDFNSRAGATLTEKGMRNVVLGDFVIDAKGCPSPLYGADATGADADGKYVKGVVCISGGTNAVFKPR